MNKTLILILIPTIILFLFMKAADVALILNIGILVFFVVSCFINFFENPSIALRTIKENVIDFFKREDFLIKVKTNGIILATVVPYKLKRKFQKQFGKEALVIEREELDFFFQKNLSNGELIEFESKKKIESDRKLANASKKLTDDFLSQRDKTYHISYYEKGGNLKVINTIEGRPITEYDVTSFRHFNQRDLKKGEKVMEHQFTKWLKSSHRN